MTTYTWILLCRCMLIMVALNSETIFFCFLFIFFLFSAQATHFSMHLVFVVILFVSFGRSKTSTVARTVCLYCDKKLTRWYYTNCYVHIRLRLQKKNNNWGGKIATYTFQKNSFLFHLISRKLLIYNFCCFGFVKLLQIKCVILCSIFKATNKWCNFQFMNIFDEDNNIFKWKKIQWNSKQ